MVDENEFNIMDMEDDDDDDDDDLPDCDVCGRDTQPEIDRLRAENERLREMLAHAYCGAHLYCDDGELQDNRTLPCIDFSRDPVDLIRNKIGQRSETVMRYGPNK